MKMNEKTIETLKSLSAVSPSILVREGNVLRTMSPMKSIYAKVKVEDNFTKKFGIYDLSQFIGVYSVFNNPSLNFKDKYLTISDEKRNVNYYYSSEDTFKAAGEKDPPLPSVDASFTLNTNSLSEMIRISNLLKLPEIAFVGDGKNIIIKGYDHKRKEYSDGYEKVGETDQEFTSVFRIENITKIIPGEYKVEEIGRAHV